ncbi:MAG: hypothetical protein EBS01_09465, partial [Verrucomicrobia bacterium]|nr:hypothetical protein [Verrucomicrobiota bacterium]
SGVGGAFLMNEKGVAGYLSVGTLALTGCNGISLSVGASAIQFNNTGAAASAAIGGNAFAFTSPDQFNFLSVSGTMTLTASVNGFAAAIAGTIGFQKTTLSINGTAQTILSVSIAGGSTSLTAGSVTLALTGIQGALLIRDSGSAGSLGVTSLVVSGVTGLTFGISNVSLDFNTTGDEVSALIGGIQLDFVGAQQKNLLVVSADLNVAIASSDVTAAISGHFLFAKLNLDLGSGVESVMALEAVNAALSFVVGSAPNGVRLTFARITGAMVLREVGFAAHLLIGAASLTKADGTTALPGLSLAFTDGALDVNTTGAAISATIGETSFAFTEADTFNFLSVSARASVAISLGSISTALAGTFTFERTSLMVNGALTSLIELSVRGGSTSLEAGGVGFALGGITGSLLLTSAGLAGQLGIETAALTGVTGVVFSGSGLVLSVNTTGLDVSATVGGTGFSFTGVSQHSFLSFGGSVSLGLSAGSVVASVAGTFNFQRSDLVLSGVPATLIQGSVTGGTTAIIVGSAVLSVTGVRGAFLLTSAGVAGSLEVGGASLAGVAGVSLAVSSVTLNLNTTGNAQAATIGSTTFDFSGADRLNFLEVAGTMQLTLAASAGSVAVAGSFGFERSSITSGGVPTTVIKVSVANASTSLTVGSGTSAPMLSASGINGALILTQQGFAGLLEIGSLAFTQADGTPLSGISMAAVRNAVIGFNTTNAAVATSIGSYTFDFSASTFRNFFSISADIDLALNAATGAFTLSGRFGFSKITPVIGGAATEVFLVTVVNASTVLTVGSAPGGARLSLSGITGAFVIGKIGGISASAGVLQVSAVTLTAADGVSPLVGNFSFAVTDLKFQFNLFPSDVAISLSSVNLGASAFPYTNSASSVSVAAAPVSSVKLALAFTGAAQRNFIAVSGTVSLDVGGFVTLNGSFGFKSQSGGEIIVVANAVSASLQLGDFKVGVTAGTLALLIRSKFLKGFFLPKIMALESYKPLKSF